MRSRLLPTLLIVSVAALLATASTLSHPTAADEPAKPAGKAAPDGKKGAEDKKKAEELSRFMRQKLAAANQVLEGLVTEDFAMIEQGAATMKRLSEAEQWRISNDVIYRQYSAQFRRVAETLQAKAKERQLDGAALAWVEGTTSCIACHKWVRNMIVAE